MGIALIMLYLPFYIVFSILGFVLCRNLLKGTESSAGEVIGFFVAVLAVVLTTILVWKFHSGEGDAGGLRKLQFLALSGLVAPFVVGIAGILSRGFSAGAYFSVFTAPWVQLCVAGLSNSS
jgi:hypothetical protein